MSPRYQGLGMRGTLLMTEEGPVLDCSFFGPLRMVPGPDYKMSEDEMKALQGKRVVAFVAGGMAQAGTHSEPVKVIAVNTIVEEATLLPPRIHQKRRR